MLNKALTLKNTLFGFIFTDKLKSHLLVNVEKIINKKQKTMDFTKTTQSFDHKSSKPEFKQEFLDVLSDAKPYVQHRLLMAERLGMIPQNMYEPEDILDDVLIEYLKTPHRKDLSEYDLKLDLFKSTKKYLDQLFKTESLRQHDISTDKLLHTELNKLKERFTYNADEDFVMNEELNDISYQQKDFIKPIKLYSDYEQSFDSVFDWGQMEKPQLTAFRSMYNDLSFEASNVIDLHLFGKLSSTEIAGIKGVSEPLIRDIILQVKDNINQIIGKLSDKE
ncbi:MAG: hypothetical protein CR968_03095 [Flavobacteriia bacterium]|nr:MAG: hypothetical protein CR968_03095 [Flavobacteriia bacterium]